MNAELLFEIVVTKDQRVAATPQSCKILAVLQTVVQCFGTFINLSKHDSVTPGGLLWIIYHCLTSTLTCCHQFSLTLFSCRLFMFEFPPTTSCNRFLVIFRIRVGIYPTWELVCVKGAVQKDAQMLG